VIEDDSVRVDCSMGDLPLMEMMEGMQNRHESIHDLLFLKRHLLAFFHLLTVLSQGTHRQWE
jgi:hypothetical protein